MPEHRKQTERRRAAGRVSFLLVVLSVLGGCSANPVTAPPPTIPAAQPAASPPVSQRPAGIVWPLAGQPSAASFDTKTSQLVVLSPGADAQAPATLTLFGARSDKPRVIATPGPATSMTGDGEGSVYLSTRGGYFVIDLASAHASRVDVTKAGDEARDIDFTAIARRTDGKTVLGSADGAVYTLSPAIDFKAESVAHTDIFARVDAVVTQGDTTIVLDRGQTSVTTIGPDGAPRHALRAGQGATTLAAEPGGPVLAADTRGGQLLVYGTDPLILRQAFPVRDAPYGLAGSDGLAWVSQTASNTVIGYDLATGIPVEKVRYPTVRQPNTLTFDDSSGTLYVVSGVGAGVQVIKHAASPR